MGHLMLNREIFFLSLFPLFSISNRDLYLEVSRNTRYLSSLTRLSQHMMWQMEDWFPQDTSLPSCFWWTPSGKGKKLSFFFFFPLKNHTNSLCLQCPRQPCNQCLRRAETPLSWHRSHHLLIPQLPTCQVCRTPPYFASTNHCDPSLDTGARRDKYHSAKSRHYKNKNKINTKNNGNKNKM